MEDKFSNSTKMKKLIRRTIRKLYYFGFPEKKIPRRTFNCVMGDQTKIGGDAAIVNQSAFRENITIGNGTHIAGSLTVWSNAGKITVGSSCFIGEGTRLFSMKHIRIGDRVQIAHDCNIFDNNIHSINPEDRYKEFIQNTTGPLIKLFNLKEKEVLIEDDAWLGAAVIVLKGVTIGKGAIVGAGSVVTKDIPAHTIAVGNPARVVKTIE